MEARRWGEKCGEVSLRSRLGAAFILFTSVSVGRRAATVRIGVGGHMTIELTMQILNMCASVCASGHCMCGTCVVTTLNSQLGKS